MTPGHLQALASGWMIATDVVLIAVGVLVAVGVWLVEARRRRERVGRAVEERVLARLRDEPTLARSWILPTARSPLLGRRIELDVIGETPTSRDHDLALRLIQEAAAHTSAPVRIWDRLRVDAERRLRA